MIKLDNYSNNKFFCETGEYNGYQYELLIKSDGYYRLTRRKIEYTLTDDEYPKQDIVLGDICLCSEGYEYSTNIYKCIEEFLDRENEEMEKFVEFVNKGLK